MHLLLRATLFLRLGDVMRIYARERHSEYSRVLHAAPRCSSKHNVFVRMQLFVTQLQPNPVVVLDRYWNALKMNAGDIEKLKGIYAGDFATLGSLSKLSPTRTSRRRELKIGR